jgi:hypothetical protein
MVYTDREPAFAKAQQLSAENHSTFTVYKLHGAHYDVVNGVDDNRTDQAVAQYCNGQQRF